MTLKIASIAGPNGVSSFNQAIDNPAFFEADYDTEEWLPTAEAAKELRPYVRDGDWRHFESRLFRYRPEHRSAKFGIEQWKSDDGDKDGKNYALNRLNLTGLTQWRIIRFIGADNFSTDRQPEISVLERKFNGKIPTRQPKYPGGFVRSPIDQEQASKMSDGNWRSAINSYCGERDRWRGDAEGPIGDAEQLASVFERCVSSDPERFVRLFKELPDTIHPAYADRFLYALQAKNAPTPLAIEGIHSAWRFQTRYFDHALMNLIESRPDVAEDEQTFTWICKQAVSGQVPKRSDELDGSALLGSLTLDDIYSTGQRITLDHSGTNRCTAWMAIANVANASIRQQEIQDLVNQQISNELCADVWPGICTAIGELAHYDRSWALKTLEQIAQRDMRLPANILCYHVFRWIIWQDRPKYEWIPREMATHPAPTVRALGYLWKNGQSLCDTADWPDLTSLETEERQAVAHIAVGNLFDEGEGSAPLRALLSIADDTDSRVVETLFSADWKQVFQRGRPYIEFARTMIASNGFPKWGNRLVYTLDDVAKEFPDIALAAAHRILDVKEAPDENGASPSSRGEFHTLGRIVVDVCTAHAERGINQSTALDLVDRFLETESYSMKSEIDAFDQRSA